MKIPVNQAIYPTSFFANNVYVDVPGELGRDTNTKERDVINSLISLVVEVKLKLIWVIFCRDDHGFSFLSIGLQEVCSEPVIDLVDVLLESFEVMPAVNRFIQGGFHRHIKLTYYQRQNNMTKVVDEGQEKKWTQDRTLGTPERTGTS